MKKIVEFLESLIVITLVLAGVGGLAFNLFRENGWLETGLGNFLNLDIQYGLMVAIMLIAAVVVFNLWRRGRVIHSRTSIIPNLFLYGLFAAGVYFIGRYVLTGAV